MVIRRGRVSVLKPGYERMKRAIDVGICLLVLPFALPLIVAAGLAIWLSDPGPVFFRQQRTGRGGQRFAMYKLRTMVTNAAELKSELLHLNDRTGPDFKIIDDPRVTPLGRFLRRTSLDELPQILNVLRGDMSLVGPRPTSFEADAYSLWHTERLEAAPGITGLWQISARGDSGFDDRVRLDIEYVESRSTSLDLWILFRTIGPVLLRRAAS